MSRSPAIALMLGLTRTTGRIQQSSVESSLTVQFDWTDRNLLPNNKNSQPRSYCFMQRQCSYQVKCRAKPSDDNYLESSATTCLCKPKYDALPEDMQVVGLRDDCGVSRLSGTLCASRLDHCCFLRYDGKQGCCYGLIDVSLTMGSMGILLMLLVWLRGRRSKPTSSIRI